MFTSDLLERAVKTFIQTSITVFAGSFVVPANVLAMSGWKAASLGALAGAGSAGISAVMSALSKPVGNRNSASMVPTATPPASAVSK